MPKKGRPKAPVSQSPFGLSLAYASVLIRAADRLRPSCYLLAVQADVETFPLLVLGDAQADHHVDHLEEDVAADTADQQGSDHAVKLGQETGVGTADFLDVEHAGEERADDPADAVHTERVQRIVVAEHLLHRSRCQEAEYACRDTDDESARYADKARSRRDGHQARDCARCDAEHRGFALYHPLGEHP